MSVFTSLVQEPVEIPHDPGQFVTIRKLSPKALDAARKESQRQSMADLRDMGGSEFLTQISSITDSQRKRIERPDPMDQHDLLALVSKGVVEWTYEREANQEAFEDLDRQTLSFLAEKILRLSDPGLFQTDEEVEADTKNG